MASVTYGNSFYGNCNYGKSIMANVTEPIGIWNTQYQNMEHLWGFGTFNFEI